MLSHWKKGRCSVRQGQGSVCHSRGRGVCQAVVYFINILHAKFLYENALRSFF